MAHEERPRTHVDSSKVTIPQLAPGRQNELRGRLLEHRPACLFALIVCGIGNGEAERLLRMGPPADVLDAAAAAIALALQGRLSGSLQGLIVRRIRGQQYQRDGLDQINYAALRMRSRGILDLPRTDRELEDGRMAWRQYASALVTGNVPEEEATGDR